MVTEYYLKGEKKTEGANSLFFGNWDTLFPVVTVQRHSMTVFLRAKRKLGNEEYFTTVIVIFIWG